MQTSVKRLKSFLNELPEPVMVVGNRVPDGDSLGCCAAILDYLRNLGIESYIYCPTDPDVTLSWMLEEEDLHPSILHDYASLVVLDDQVSSSRLGIPIKADVPIVCVDHHIGNFPDNLKEAIVSSTSPVVYTTDNAVYFYDFKVATACLLIDEGIYHPYLWISLYADSVGFKVNPTEAIFYAAKLGAALDLTDLQVESMLQKFNQIASLSDLQAFLEGSFFLIEGTLFEKPLSIIVARSLAQTNIAYKKILSSLLAFADVVAFVNTETGKTSLRSRTFDFNVMEVAQKFGGGGHIRAAGATLNVEDLLNDMDRLFVALIDKIDNPTTRWYA